MTSSKQRSFYFTKSSCGLNLATGRFLPRVSYVLTPPSISVAKIMAQKIKSGKNCTPTNANLRYFTSQDITVHNLLPDDAREQFKPSLGFFVHVYDGQIFMHTLFIF